MTERKKWQARLSIPTAAPGEQEVLMETLRQAGYEVSMDGDDIVLGADVSALTEELAKAITREAEVIHGERHGQYPARVREHIAELKLLVQNLETLWTRHES